MHALAEKSLTHEMLYMWERMVYPWSSPSCLTHQVSTLAVLWGHLCDSITSKQENLEVLIAMLPQALLVVAANHFGQAQC